MSQPLHDCRRAYAQTLAEIARRDDRLVVVVNDSVGSSNLGALCEEFPNRVINVAKILLKCFSFY